ncbi:MAG: S8 family serine peptidase [Phycisphaerales bacterium]|nr:S8 family serine peptidase [Phycisphaerales bacterium]
MVRTRPVAGLLMVCGGVIGFAALGAGGAGASISGTAPITMDVQLGPAVSLMPEMDGDGAPAALGLELRTGFVDTAEPVGGLEKLAGQAGHFVVQLSGPITPARRTALEGAGIVLGDYLPANAWVVRMEGADAEKVAALGGEGGFVRWHSPFLGDWKIDPEVGARAYTTDQRITMHKAGRLGLVVTMFDGLRGGDVLDRLAAMPGVAIQWHEVQQGNMTVCLSMDAADLMSLGAMDEVQFVEDAPELTERNSTTRWIIQSNVTNDTPLYDNGLHGEGQIVGVLDSNVDRNHCSFVDTVPIGPGHRKIVAYNGGAGAQFHGTHVAGTAVGDAGNNTDTRGLAYMGKLAWGPIPGFGETSILTALNTHHNQGARVHTNSWGNDGTTAYDALCRGFDVFQYNNEDDVVTLAVTNLSQLKNPENAKNLLAVGNSQDTPSQGNHCTGGTGPTADGRRKPEVYAPGCNTNSAQSGSSCGVAQATGTSMATPAVAGISMMVRQYFMDGFYPGGVAGGGVAFTPSGALIKSIVINSSVDMTGPAGYPSNQEGWGRVLIDNALFFADDTRKLQIHDQRNADGLSTGGEVVLTANVVSSSLPLRFTLVTTEPAGAANASNPVVNDLDLVVTSPNGDVYKGNVFTGGQSATGGLRDQKNNVEQVHLTTPTPGTWTITVSGAAVNVGPQGFAVAITGDVVSGPVPVSVSFVGTVPGLVLPHTEVPVTVQIRPGDDTLVDGSPELHYRADPLDPFATIELVATRDDLYTATLPGFDCGDQPEFYATAEGVTSGLKSAPAGAPANTFDYEIGEIATSVVLTEDFAAAPVGWTTTGLWHHSSLCPITPTCDGGSSWMAYNQDSNCNFNNGGTNSGTMTSPMIALPPVPPGGTITMTYCSNLDTEPASSYDLAFLFIGADQLDEPSELDTWETRTVDLTSYAGQSVQLRFSFNTVDGIQNDHRGWQVDNISISAQVGQCIQPPEECVADFNDDTVISSADITAFLGAWFADLTGGTTVADVNGDLVTTSADITAFLAAWFEALVNGC